MGVVNYTPKDWAAAEFVDETDLDDEIKTPWTNLQSSWTSFTPTWTGATTNPTIGNGTWDSAYHRWGKTVVFRIAVTMGSTTTYGSGLWSFTLPVSPKATWQRFYGNAYDVSAATPHFPIAGIWDGTKLIVSTPATTAGNGDRSVLSTAPFTWATGDVLNIAGSYETA